MGSRIPLMLITGWLCLPSQQVRRPHKAAYLCLQTESLTMSPFYRLDAADHAKEKFGEIFNVGVTNFGRQTCCS